MPRTDKHNGAHLPERAYRRLIQQRLKLGRSWVDAMSHHFYDAADRIRSRTDLLDHALGEHPRYEEEYDDVAEAEARRWHDPTSGQPCDDMDDPCLLCRAEAVLNEPAA